uniref:EMI domain-containing protein n=1 Tax=Clastoptera arizonana TaxID=38151 RepID=A0A1B6CAP6_9HEMI
MLLLYWGFFSLLIHLASTEKPGLCMETRIEEVGSKKILQPCRDPKNCEISTVLNGKFMESVTEKIYGEVKHFFCCNGYYRSASKKECLPKCDPGCVNGLCESPGVCRCNEGYSLKNKNTCVEDSKTSTTKSYEVTTKNLPEVKEGTTLGPQCSNCPEGCDEDGACIQSTNIKTTHTTELNFQNTSEIEDDRTSCEGCPECNELGICLQPPTEESIIMLDDTLECPLEPSPIGSCFNFDNMLLNRCRFQNHSIPLVKIGNVSLICSIVMLNGELQVSFRCQVNVTCWDNGKRCSLIDPELKDYESMDLLLKGLYKSKNMLKPERNGIDFGVDNTTLEDGLNKTPVEVCLCAQGGIRKVCIEETVILSTCECKTVASHFDAEIPAYSSLGMFVLLLVAVMLITVLLLLVSRKRSHWHVKGRLYTVLYLTGQKKRHVLIYV